MTELKLVKVSAACADLLESYRAAFPAARERVTHLAERIPGLDHLEECQSLAEWLDYCQSMEGKISWYLSVRESDGKAVGCACLRHRLEYDDDDPEFCSHIGYSIRPDERQKGYAREQLRLVLEKAREAGLKVGAYFYSQALNMEEAREEAILALEILDGFQLDMPLVYDWEQEERTKNVKARTLTDCTLAFCEVVESAGYEPMVYFNSFQAQELLILEELTHLPWWLAMYDITAEFPYKVDMWQYTCTGSIPGIEGNVDINLLFEEIS